MIVAIVGVRDGAPEQDIVDYVNALPPLTVVVSGGARGTDSIAASAARARGLSVREFKPNWNGCGSPHSKHVEAHRRNTLIVEAADKVVAFWDGRDGGTKLTVSIARKIGKPVEVRHLGPIVQERLF